MGKVSLLGGRMGWSGRGRTQDVQIADVVRARESAAQSRAMAGEGDGEKWMDSSNAGDKT